VEAGSRSAAPKGDLVPVHGGLAEHVDRTVSLKDRKHFLREAATLPPVRVSRADLSTVYRIADGALSPLEGPMKARAFELARDEAVVEANGRRYAWGIPLAFPVSDEEARALKAGGAAAIRTGTSRSTWSACTARGAPTIRARASRRTTRARSCSAGGCTRCRSRSTPSTATTCSRPAARAR
jgi:hypothetical protein